MTWLILDIATAALPDAADYVTPAAERKPPKNYTKADTIAAWQAEAVAEDIARAALDLDLARLSGMAYWQSGQEGPVVWTDRYRAEVSWEAQTLKDLAGLITGAEKLITYGGHFFDLPLLMRRAKYLGVAFPWVNVDKYRSPHMDLLDLMSDRDPQRRKSLGFYVRRLKMGLTKPLAGADEAKVYEHGRWDDLAASLEHDVTAIKRLAEWAGVIK
jgi:hypothetical protein